ncbi:MAG: DUF47 family protein [Actinomycetota bacterium]|nr:DUF47 family protein [Actinomycetota bacterium]
MSRFRRLLKELSGRGYGPLVQLLLDQIDAALEGAALAQQAALGEASPAWARREMTEVEHRGDEGRQQLVGALSRTLVTPIDREDIFRLSRSVDDVLDTTRDFVRELDLFGVTGKRALPMIEAIHDGLQRLRDAVAGLQTDLSQVAVQSLAAKKATNLIRQAYQQQLADLLTGGVTAEMLRIRELLRRLDHVGLRLGEAADVLADGAMKRSH